MVVECASCGAKGNVDEAKRPAGVNSVRCPKCGANIPLLTQESPGPSAAPQNPQSLPAQQDPQPLPTPASAGSVPAPALQSAEPRPVSQSAEPVLTPQVGEPRPEEQASEPAPLPQSAEPAPLEPEPSPFRADAPPAARADCMLCGGSFSRDNMVRFGSDWVCGGCKPEYVQMIAQGMPRPNDYRYAGFWIRFCAKFLDGLLLMVVNLIINTLLAVFITKGSNPGQIIGISALTSLFQFAVGGAYVSYFLSGYQATPGKMVCGLKVITPSGDAISWQRGLGRYFAELLSGIILGIGYLMIAFDEEKRALHDRLCDTRVVYK
jgi:predicted Zn finger-like uncharacterized protein